MAVSQVENLFVKKVHDICRADSADLRVLVHLSADHVDSDDGLPQLVTQALADVLDADPRLKGRRIDVAFQPSVLHQSPVSPLLVVTFDSVRPQQLGSVSAPPVSTKMLLHHVAYLGSPPLSTVVLDAAYLQYLAEHNNNESSDECKPWMY